MTYDHHDYIATTWNESKNLPTYELYGQFGTSTYFVEDTRLFKRSIIRSINKTYSILVIRS